MTPEQVAEQLAARRAGVGAPRLRLLDVLRHRDRRAGRRAAGSARRSSTGRPRSRSAGPSCRSAGARASPPSSAPRRSTVAAELGLDDIVAFTLPHNVAVAARDGEARLRLREDGAVQGLRRPRALPQAVVGAQRAAGRGPWRRRATPRRRPGSTPGSRPSSRRRRAARPARRSSSRSITASSYSRRPACSGRRASSSGRRTSSSVPPSTRSSAVGRDALGDARERLVGAGAVGHRVEEVDAVAHRVGVAFARARPRAPSSSRSRRPARDGRARGDGRPPRRRRSSAATTAGRRRSTRTRARAASPWRSGARTGRRRRRSVTVCSQSSAPVASDVSAAPTSWRISSA